MNHDDKIKKSFGNRAKFYTTSSTHADPVILEKMVHLVEPQENWNVLDVATGTGHTAFAFAPHVKSIIGIDLTLEMLEEAKELNKQYDFMNIDFQQGNVNVLNFSDEIFDLITCRRAFHHFSDKDLALQQMNRVLKHGGILLIDDRSIPEKEDIDQIMNTLDILHDSSHVREYNAKEWDSMLNSNGFEVISSEMYIQHRPLSTLTNQVDEENIAKIEEIINNLTSQQKNVFNLRMINGETYLNHWYIMIKAQKVN